MQSACHRCGRPGGGGNLSSHGSQGTGDHDSADTVSTRGCTPKETDEHRPIEPCLVCKNERHVFDQCVALWTYQDLVCDAVVGAKFGSRIALADALARRLAERIRSSGLIDDDPPSIITSVPSHLLRRIRRGWGGSRVIAEVVSKELSRDFLPLHCDGQPPSCLYRELLVTTRQIQKQALLGEGERESNVAGAFRLRGLTFPKMPSIRFGVSESPPRRTSLKESHVMLIDDVMTTGATTNEVSRVLKAGGVRRVTVAVVARACSE